jgi:hypothetical protein
MFGENSPM